MSLKMSPEEKVFLDKLVAVSGKDITTIRDVLRSILVLFSLEAYSGDEEVIIPYIGKFSYTLVDRCTPVKGTYTKVNMKSEACEALIEELSAINEGEQPPSLEFFRKNIKTSLLDILEIEEDDDILIHI